MLHKYEARPEAYKPKHYKEGIRYYGHVSEIEASLEPAIHIGTLKEIEERISIDEEARRSATEKRAPPPTMILTCKLKVHKSHSDEACDNKEHDEGDEENAEKCVNLVTPNGSKNIVQLDVYGTKGKEARHKHLRDRSAVPWDIFWDLSCNLGSTAWCLKIRRKIATCDSANHSKWKRNK